MPRDLPNELIDAIISSMPATRWPSPEEKQTLRNCTLVCRDRLPASRHALFSHVVLTSPAAWDSFVLWIVDAEEGRPWLASIYNLTFADRRHSFKAEARSCYPSRFQVGGASMSHPSWQHAFPTSNVSPSSSIGFHVHPTPARSSRLFVKCASTRANSRPSELFDAFSSRYLP